MGCLNSNLRKDGDPSSKAPSSKSSKGGNPPGLVLSSVISEPPTPTWAGAYLIYKAEAMGTLYLLWSKTNPQGKLPPGHVVLLYLEPGKELPAHKFKTNQGRVELAKNVDNRKLFFQQVTSALQQLITETQATQIHLLEQPAHAEFRVCFLYHDTNLIKKMFAPGDFNYKLDPQHLNAIAVISFQEQCLDCNNLAEPLFLQYSQHSGGAASKLRKSEAQLCSNNSHTGGGVSPAGSAGGGAPSSHQGGNSCAPQSGCQSPLRRRSLAQPRKMSARISALAGMVKSKHAQDEGTTTNAGPQGDDDADAASKQGDQGLKADVSTKLDDTTALKEEEPKCESQGGADAETTKQVVDAAGSGDQGVVDAAGEVGGQGSGAGSAGLGSGDQGVDAAV